VLPGQTVQVRESNPTKEIGGALTAVSPATEFANDQEQWVTWQEVPDFYASDPTNPHYTLDRQTGELRFGDGQNGRLPPEGQNNIRAAHYRTGGGQRGNREAQTIVQLKTSIPYLAEVINYEAAVGGAEQESIEQVKRYAPRQLRHRDRAVTIEDVEDLAFAASSEVARTKAIPPQFRPMNLWLDLDQEPGELPIHQRALAGEMGLIIVPHSSAPRPVPTPALIARVQQYVQARASATAKLWVSGPQWVEVQIATTIVPTSIETADWWV
jgi:predicted phage baseplate assembly protein